MIPKRTPHFLLANLGAEVDRMIIAKEKRDLEALRILADRSCALLQTIRLREEMRMRDYELLNLDLAIREFAGENSLLDIRSADLESCLHPFMIRFSRQLHG